METWKSLPQQIQKKVICEGLFSLRNMELRCITQGLPSVTRYDFEVRVQQGVS